MSSGQEYRPPGASRTFISLLCIPFPPVSQAGARVRPPYAGGERRQGASCRAPGARPPHGQGQQHPAPQLVIVKAPAQRAGWEMTAMALKPNSSKATGRVKRPASRKRAATARSPCPHRPPTARAAGAPDIRTRTDRVLSQAVNLSQPDRRKMVATQSLASSNRPPLHQGKMRSNKGGQGAWQGFALSWGSSRSNQQVEGDEGPGVRPWRDPEPAGWPAACPCRQPCSRRQAAASRGMGSTRCPGRFLSARADSIQLPDRLTAVQGHLPERQHRMGGSPGVADRRQDAAPAAPSAQGHGGKPLGGPAPRLWRKAARPAPAPLEAGQIPSQGNAAVVGKRTSQSPKPSP